MPKIRKPPLFCSVFISSRSQQLFPPAHTLTLSSATTPFTARPTVSVTCQVSRTVARAIRNAKRRGTIPTANPGVRAIFCRLQSVKWTATATLPAWPSRTLNATSKLHTSTVCQTSHGKPRCTIVSWDNLLVLLGNCVASPHKHTRFCKTL
jgi:hypothetical protein